MKNLRKSLIIGVMALTVWSMTGISFASAAAPQAGDLIKMDGLSTVYFLGNDGKRYVYPTSAVYFSWHKDFSGVVTVSASELQSYPLGSNIVMRAGTKLVKITTDPSVYAVEANGVLRKIASEADAIAIYGANWAKRVVDVPDAFFTNYTIGSALTSGQVPAGSLVKNAGSSAIYYYDGTNYRSIPSEAAFNANRFDFANVITLSSAITAGGTAITGAEYAYDAQGNTPNNVVTTTGVTVSVSANSAPASSIIAGQALADMASFNFTASNDGAAIIKTIKLKRTGISSDTSLDNVYLYDGVTRLTDGASFSNGYVSFSNGTGIITIPAGQTKTISVKADVNASANGNIGVAINAASDIISSAATVTGSFPISGNLMSPTTATDTSKVVLTNTLATSGNTAKAGNTNTIVWSETAAVSQKSVDFKYIAFKQIGSINADDLANLSLYVDGTKVATGVLSNNDLAFNLATPVRLNTGNHTIEVKADIVKGSSRTFSFSLQTAANAIFTDTNYNVNVAATGVSTAISVAPAFTISSGTLSVSADSTFNDTQIVKTATNATISKFKVKAYGEDVKVNTLAIDVIVAGTAGSTSTEKINDLAIIVDGTQVGSSKSIPTSGSLAATTYNVSYGTTNLFTIPAGHEAIVEIKGSLSLDSNTTLTSVKANISGITGQGVTSYSAVTGAAATANNTLSIVSGSMTIAKNTNTQNQNVSKNTQKVKIGSYILSAGSAEGVNISNVRVNLTLTGTSSTLMDSVSNLYISENTTPVNPQVNNDFNTNLTIDKSQSKTIDVYADLGDLANATKVDTALVVTYKTTVTQTFGTSASVAGQTMTLATASLATPTNVSDSPASNFVIGGTTATAAKLKFVATNGTATINELYFDVTSSVDAISQITVDGVTAPVIGGKVTMTGLNTAIAAGLQGVNVEVKAAYNNVTSEGQGGVATGNTVTLALRGMKYTVNGTQATLAYGSFNVPTNSMKLVSSYPTVTDLSSYGTANLVPSGKSEVMRFSVTSGSNNPVNLKQISLTPYFDYTVTGNSIKVYDANDLSNVLSTATSTFSTSGTASNVGFINDVTISAGSTRTFVVYADNTGTASTTGNYFRMDMVNTGWLWNDATITGTINGTYVKEFTGATFKK